ncbi:MAG: chromate transporter [Christensenellaceae bacterium]
MKEYWTLFWTFCRIGGLTFGGGYAMLPMLEKEVVERHHWTTQEQLLDYFAIGQCTPGIIAVNTATFIGYNRRGVLGAVIATLGVVFPSFIIISLISAVLNNFAHIAMVQHAFSGIRVAVCGLILQAVIKLLKSSVKNAMGWILLAVTFLAVVLFDLSPVIVVIAAALTGILAGRGRQKA